MPIDPVTFAVDPAAPPEHALAAAGFAEGLRDLGRDCEVLVDPWPEALAGRMTIIEVGATEHAGDRWRIEIGPRSDLELIGFERTSTIPFPLPALPPSHGGKPRIFLIGGGDGGRRARMMLKLLDALRGYSGCEVVFWRNPSDEILRQRAAAEVHPDLSAAELARLLGSAAALVEVSDEATPEAMLLAAFGRSSGIPTVVHEAFPGDRWEGTVTVRDWSGEAFADGAIAAAKLGRNETAAAAVRKEAAGRLAGALFS